MEVEQEFISATAEEEKEKEGFPEKKLVPLPKTQIISGIFWVTNRSYWLRVTTVVSKPVVAFSKTSIMRSKRARAMIG